jgi:hypothetical protein
MLKTPAFLFADAFALFGLIIGWICDVYSSAIGCRVVVQGAGPGPRYGHCMDLVAQRYLVTVSGNDG